MTDRHHTFLLLSIVRWLVRRTTEILARRRCDSSTIRTAGGDAANGLQRIILGSRISGEPYAATAAAAALLMSITSSEFFSHFPTKDAAEQTIVRSSKRDEIDFILFSTAHKQRKLIQCASK